MKKTLYIAAAVIAVMFVASCQKDYVQAAKKGMTLSANVEETKATIDRDDTGEKVVWHFNWETGDVVSVTSPSDGNPYDFTYDGKSFKNAEAEPAKGKWTAVYPKSYTTEGISFGNQDGTLESAMKKYLLKGSDESDGSATLNITMNPQVAILKVNLNPSFFSGHSSTGTYKRAIIFMDSDQQKFFYNITKDGELTKSSSANIAYDFSKGDIPTEPIYLIAPAGVELYLSNQFHLFTSLKSLEAGHIYNVTLK